MMQGRHKGISHSSVPYVRSSEYNEDADVVQHGLVAGDVFQGTTLLAGGADQGTIFIGGSSWPVIQLEDLETSAATWSKLSTYFVQGSISSAVVGRFGAASEAAGLILPTLSPLPVARFKMLVATWKSERDPFSSGIENLIL